RSSGLRRGQTPRRRSAEPRRGRRREWRGGTVTGSSWDSWAGGGTTRPLQRIRRAVRTTGHAGQIAGGAPGKGGRKQPDQLPPPSTLQPQSAFAHAFGWLVCAPGAHLVLDALADFGVHVLPIREGAFQHRAAHAAEQAAGDLFDELRALGVVPYLAHHRAGLAKVIVLRVQRIGAAHHLAVGLPAAFHRAGVVRPGAPAAVWRV